MAVAFGSGVMSSHGHVEDSETVVLLFQIQVAISLTPA